MDQEQAHARLIDYIASKVSLSENDKIHIRNAYRLTTLKKRDYLFKQGETCSVLGFIVSGTLRVYYLDSKGLEHVLYFGFPDWWVGDIASFYSGEKGALAAQALEQSELLVIDPEKSELLFKKVPALERLFRVITQKHLSALQNRFLLTVSEPVQERYKALLKKSPGIEQLVPQHQIASYLGILPESLSRMKKQLLKGNN